MVTYFRFLNSSPASLSQDCESWPDLCRTGLVVCDDRAKPKRSKDKPKVIARVARASLYSNANNVKLTLINGVAIMKFRRTSPGHQYYKQY